MSNVRISDLVDPEAIRSLKELDAELKSVLDTYVNVAKELAQGMKVEVKTVGDIDRLEQLLAVKGKEAVETQNRLNDVLRRQSEVVANTTNTIQRYLMEQERVNKTSREAYADQEKVKRLLEQFHDTYEEQINFLNRINNQLKENKKQQSDNEKALKAGRMSASEYAKAQAELVMSTRSLMVQKRALNSIMTAEEKANQAAEGSYVQLSQQLELLKKAYKEMSDETKGSDYGKELEQTIQNLDAHLKDMAADMGEFQRNVGNYAIAGNGMNKQYEEQIAVLAALRTEYDGLSDAQKSGEEGRKLAENIEKVSEAARQAKQSIDEHNKALEDARRSLGETGGSVNSVRRDLKDLVLEIANLSIEYRKLSDEERASAEGQELAEKIRDITERAGELKDAMNDTKTAIANASSDTRGFDQLGEATQLAVDGFGLAAGAAEMLGISEGELAEIQTKLQAAIAASNSMSKIQTTLQKESALMQGVAKIQTIAATKAIQLKTAAEGKGIVTTKLLTAAQWLLNKAVSSNPIVLIVGGIVAAVGAVASLTKAYLSFTDSSREANKELEKSMKMIDAVREGHEGLIAELENVGASQTLITRQKLICYDSEIEAIKKSIEEAKKDHASKEEIAKAEEKLLQRKEEQDAAYEKARARMSKKVTEQAQLDLKERIGEAAFKKRLVDDEIDDEIRLVELMKARAAALGQDLKQYEDMLAALEKQRGREKKEIDKDAAKKYKKVADDLKKEVRAGEDALLNIIKDGLERRRQAEELSYRRRLEDIEEKLSKTTAKEVKKREALNNQIKGLEAEHQNNLRELEADSMERRLSAQADFLALRLEGVKEGSSEEFDLKRQQLTNQRDMEYLAVYKMEQDKTITTEEALERRAALVEKYAKKETDLIEEEAAKQVEAIEKKYADQTDEANTSMVVEQNNLRRRYLEELKMCGGNEDKKAKLKERYEKASAEISRKYAIQVAQKAVDMYTEILSNEKLSAKEREDIERRLAKARAELNSACLDQMEKDTEDFLNKGKSFTQKWWDGMNWKEKVEFILNSTAEAAQSITDLMSAIYENRIADIEKEQEANEAAGEAEQDHISKLVEQKVITEEEGEARKRAAEAKTAKKNEELEKKKAKLQERQAKWDKANSIVQAGIATALAITKALPNFVTAALAAAFGAAQIATIVATPLPKYAKGTDYHKGGPAIVGDGGVPELIAFAGKTWITPDSPTLVDLPEGAVVLPEIPTFPPLPLPIKDLFPVPEPVIIEPEVRSAAPYNDAKIIERLDSLIALERRNARAIREAEIDAQAERYARDRGL